MQVADQLEPGFAELPDGTRLSVREFMDRYGSRLGDVPDAKLAVWVRGWDIGLKTEGIVDAEVFAVSEAVTKLIPALTPFSPFLRPFLIAGEAAFVHQTVKRMNREHGHVEIITARHLLRGLEGRE